MFVPSPVPPALTSKHLSGCVAHRIEVGGPIVTIFTGLGFGRQAAHFIVKFCAQPPSLSVLVTQIFPPLLLIVKLSEASLKSGFTRFPGFPASGEQTAHPFTHFAAGVPVPPGPIVTIFRDFGFFRQGAHFIVKFIAHPPS